MVHSRCRRRSSSDALTEPGWTAANRRWPTRSASPGGTYASSFPITGAWVTRRETSFVRVRVIQQSAEILRGLARRLPGHGQDRGPDRVAKGRHLAVALERELAARSSLTGRSLRFASIRARAEDASVLRPSVSSYSPAAAVARSAARRGRNSRRTPCRRPNLVAEQHPHVRCQRGGHLAIEVRPNGRRQHAPRRLLFRTRRSRPVRSAPRRPARGPGTRRSRSSSAAGPRGPAALAMEPHEPVVLVELDCDQVRTRLFGVGVTRLDPIFECPTEHGQQILCRVAAEEGAGLPLPWGRLRADDRPLASCFPAPRIGQIGAGLRGPRCAAARRSRPGRRCFPPPSATAGSHPCAAGPSGRSERHFGVWAASVSRLSDSSTRAFTANVSASQPTTGAAPPGPGARGCAIRRPRCPGRGRRRRGSIRTASR